MKQRVGPVMRLASPLKAWVQRFAFLMLVAAAVSLLVVGRTNLDAVSQARSAVTDAITPILALLTRPTDVMVEAIDSVRELGDLRAENARLREERARLLQWQSAARQLDAENRELRALLKLAPDPQIDFISARVVGDLGGAFVRSALVDAGARDGAVKGQAAITGEGLAGRVLEVGNRASRILLLTDINSRIPVVIERTRDRGVVAGDNSELLRLLYLDPEVEVSVGDRVVTSGHGGAIVPGLPVGIVTEVGERAVKVQPLVDWDRLNYVRLLDYELVRNIEPLMGPAGPEAASALAPTAEAMP
ncbi:MAG: cell shape-determining protein MreC [Alphaproteobacteria bacterium]|nr:MAG: cell shape-determining protein MreC [Alphaproteobacteria bacterium]